MKAKVTLRARRLKPDCTSDSRPAGWLSGL